MTQNTPLDKPTVAIASGARPSWVEYALIILLAMVVVLVILTILGPSVGTVYSGITTSI